MPFEKVDPLGSYLGTKPKLQQLEAGKQRLEAGQQAMSLQAKQAEQQQKMQQRQVLSDMANAAEWADTPEKWEQVLDTYETTGMDVEPYRGGFELREAVMALKNPNQDLALRRLRLAEEQFRAVKTGSTTILEDGTTIQATNKGPVVYSPEGELLKGKAAAEQVRIAQETKVTNQRKAAGEKRRASLEAENDLKAKVEAGVINAQEAAKASVKAADSLNAVRGNIATVNEAIKLIDEGAGTGFIASRLPSVRAASIKLDNIQKRLGLDIIGSVTFGALSQGELDLALSTALPTGLEGPELKQWLIDKRNAQEAVADHLEAAAIFLGTKGNTHSDWIKYLKSKQKKEEKSINVGRFKVIEE